MYANICCNFRRQKCDQERSQEDSIYKDLTIEIQYMWNITMKVTPVITVATGTFSKSFRKYLSHILGKQEIN
jgi:hypothetical protein